jgi:hypothetical protein
MPTKQIDTTQDGTSFPSWDITPHSLPTGGATISPLMRPLDPPGDLEHDRPDRFTKEYFVTYHKVDRNMTWEAVCTAYEKRWPEPKVEVTREDAFARLRRNLRNI